MYRNQKPVVEASDRTFVGSYKNSSRLKPFMYPARVLIKIGASEPFAYFP